jgi:uncharacterized protein (TIGR03437 family)
VERLFLIPATPSVLYAKIGKEVFKTTDSGNLWTLQTTLPADCGAAAFMVHAGFPSQMYCAPNKDEKGEGGRVLSSSDEGATWRASSYTERLGPDWPTSQYVYWFNSLASPAGAPGTLYANVNSSWSVCLEVDGTVVRWNDTIFKSVNGGATFEPVLSPNSGRIAVHPARPELVFVYRAQDARCATTPPSFATAPDLFRSENVAASFSRISVPHGTTTFSGNGGTYVDSGLAFWARDPNVIYAPCPGSGVCRSSDAGREWTRLAGTVRYTLAKPAAPVAFTLGSGERGTGGFTATFAEAPGWTGPVEVAASGASWLTIKADKVTPASVTVSVNTAGLAPGSYEASIRVSSAHAVGDLVVPVKLAVTSASNALRYVVRRVAGTGAEGGAGDNGPATEAALSGPAGLWLDSKGNLYIAEYAGHRVRKVSPEGVITTVAGTGKKGAAGEGGPAVKAELDGPRGVTTDTAGNVYIAEWGGNRLLKIDQQGNLIRLVKDMYGAGSVVVEPDGYLLVAGISNIFRVTPTGGASQLTPYGALKYPTAIALDLKGDMIVSDSGGYIRKVTRTGAVSTIAGTGASGYTGEGAAASAAFYRPEGVAVDADGNIWVADTWNHRIRVIGADGMIQTVAGTGKAGSKGEPGPAAAAELYSPYGVLADKAGDIYVADRYSHRVLKLVKQPDVQPKIASGPLNAASMIDVVAPGSLAVVDGTDLASDTAQPVEIPWPTTLAGSTVLINGVPAPLYWASPGRLAFQIPFEIAPGEATLEVKRGDAVATVSFTVLEAGPGIIVGDGNRAWADNEDGSRNGPDKPALTGTIVLVRFTGLGATDNPVVTGAAAPQEPLARPVLPSKVQIGGLDCEVIYLGMTPLEVGTAQANCRVPDLADGDYEVVITVGNYASKPALISVRRAPAQE